MIARSSLVKESTMPTITDNDGNSIIQCDVPGCRGVIVIGREETAEGWWIDENGLSYCPTHRELASTLPTLPKTGKKSSKPDAMPEIAKVKTYRPPSLKHVTYKTENAADVIMVHMLESLDWLQGMIRCDEIPLEQRMTAVQHLIKAGNLVIPKSSIPVPAKAGASSKKETANPTSNIPRSQVEELIKMFSGDEVQVPGTPGASPVPSGDVPVPGEEGFEPVEYEGEEDPRPVIPNLAQPGRRRKPTYEEKVMRSLREHGDLPLSKLEGCFLTGKGWTVEEGWRNTLERMVKEGKIVKFKKCSGHNYGLPMKEGDDEP
jgi:hypothetical protein